MIDRIFIFFGSNHYSISVIFFNLIRKTLIHLRVTKYYGVFNLYLPLRELKYIINCYGVCCPIKRAATVQTPGHISATKQNMKKYFFGDFLSAQIWQKNLWVNRNWHEKFLKNIYHSASTLNYRYRHLCIKLTLKWCYKLGRNIIYD